MSATYEDLIKKVKQSTNPDVKILEPLILEWLMQAYNIGVTEGIKKSVSTGYQKNR